MSKLTKKQKLAFEKIEAGKNYTLKEASVLVKDITSTKFDSSVDVDVRLGVDPRYRERSTSAGIVYSR
jgi:large subunit ribosomal protein L1